MVKKVLMETLLAILLISSLLIIITIPTVQAADTLPIYVRPLSAGSLRPSTTLSYELNFTSDSACNNVILTHSENITTDQYGLGFAEIDISSMSSNPSYLCEYREGSLRETHNITSGIFDNIHAAGNANITGNLTLGQKITFAFGEVIDNIVNGWITITGSLNVTGNITSENTFIAHYIFSHTNATQPVIGAGTWTNISFDQEDSDVKYGISHTYSDNTNHTFMIMEDGIYNVDFDLDLEDTSLAASDINVAGRLILIDGTEVNGSVFETDIIKQGAEVEVSHNFLAECTSGDVFIFQFIASDADVQISTHGSYGDHPESATVLMYKIANLP